MMEFHFEIIFIFLHLKYFISRFQFYYFRIQYVDVIGIQRIVKIAHNL